MLTRSRRNLSLFATFSFAAAVAALAVLSAGCGGSSAGQPAAGGGTGTAGSASSAGSASTQPFVRFFSPPKQGGAQIWAASCNRCHYAPSPTDFSPREWDVVVQHMRLRANLTGEEARAVADFLKAGS